MKENHTIKVSIFKTLQTIKPEEITISWHNFATDYLQYHQPLQNKDERSLWSPAIFSGKRSNDTVIEHSVIAIDFDDGIAPRSLVKGWDEMGLEYMLHQTFGCKPDHLKWRAVFPLSEPLSKRDYALKIDKIREVLCKGYDDKATRDQARMYFLPTINSEHYHAPDIHGWTKGKPLDVTGDEWISTPASTKHTQSEKPRAIIMPSELEWYDEWNINGRDYCAQLLMQRGWSSNQYGTMDFELWTKPEGNQQEHHATVKYYDNAGLFMFYNFSSKAEPFQENKAYNWSDLANILLFPEEHSKNVKAKLWRHLSSLNLITKKAPSYTVSKWDEDKQEKPIVELSPISELSTNVLRAMAKVNEQKEDIDKLYLNNQKLFTLASRKDNILSTTPMKPYAIAVWLEREAIIVKDGEPVDGLPNAVIQRLGGISASVNDSDLTGIPTLKGFSTFPTITMRNAKSSKPHYDKKSGRIVCVDEKSQAVIKQSFVNPSLEKAKDASEKLRGIFHDTPFLSENDWAKCLSMIITPFLCDIYNDSIPITIVKASQAESGKTELSKGIMAFTGRNNIITYHKSMDIERALGSYIVDDSRVVLLDNVTGFFSNDYLSVLSSNREISVRLLYKEAMSVPNNLMLIVSANNPRVSDDIASRSVEINIHVDKANPGSRNTKYKVLPSNYILNNYTKCLGWIMDLLAYGLVFPQTGESDYKVVTRHTTWERLVQSILNPIGIYPDFSRSYEPEDEDCFSVFVRNWYSKHKETRVSVSDLTRLAFYDGEREGLMSFLTEYQKQNTLDESKEKLLYQSLGHIMSKNKNRCIKYPDNLELKITKGRNTAGSYYALVVLSLPTSEITEPKQMRFDEAPVFVKPEPIGDFDDDDIFQFDEWVEI
jgi:hypothetical protein